MYNYFFSLFEILGTTLHLRWIALFFKEYVTFIGGFLQR